MDSVFFLDSWGRVYETCNPNDNDAVAFGPRGAARHIATDAYNFCKETGEEEAGFTLVELG